MSIDYVNADGKEEKITKAAAVAVVSGDKVASAHRGYSDQDISDEEAAPTELTAWEVIKEEVPKLKWRILVICCLLPIGSYYVYGRD